MLLTSLSRWNVLKGLKTENRRNNFFSENFFKKITKVHKSLKIDSWQICFSSPSVSPSRRQTMPQPLSGLLVAIIIIIIIIIIVTIIIVIVIIVILREAPPKDNRFYLGHQLTQTCEPTSGPLTQISRFGSFTMNLPEIFDKKMVKCAIKNSDL